MRSPAKVILQHFRWFFAHRRAPFIAQNPTRLIHPTALLPPGLLDEGGGGLRAGDARRNPSPHVTRANQRHSCSRACVGVVVVVVVVSSGTRSRSRSSGRSGSFSRSTPDTQPEHPSRPRSSKMKATGKSQFFIVPPWGTSQGGTIIHNSPAAPAGANIIFYGLTLGEGAPPMAGQ